MAKSNKVPMFIGVTAHRRFRDSGCDGELRKAVRKAITDITGKFSHTEFILLTALAAGGDQIAAEVAVSMGMRYGVVLPMRMEEYFWRGADSPDPDFTAPERENALRLMADKEHCAFVYTMPAEKTDRADEQAQFQAAARFISDNSCAVIALWDGRYTPGSTAGTGAAVCDSLHGNRYHGEYFSGITVPETRPIFHIYTPREVKGQPCPEPDKSIDYKIRRLYPEPLLETGDSWFTLTQELPKGSKAIAARLSDQHSAKHEGREKKFFEYLRNIDKYNACVEREPEPACAPGKWGRRAELCEKHRAVCSGLAIRLQAIRKATGIAIILVAGLGYVLLSIFGDLYNRPWLLAGFFLALVCAAVTDYIADRFLIHERFVNYRAIAEGLRVQKFWYAADILGKDNLPAQVQDYYLRRQKGEIEWVRYVIRSINLMAITGFDASGADEHAVKQIADEWLGRMDIEQVDPKSGKTKWVHPTDTLRGNGQSGYFLANSLKRRRDVSPKAGAKRKDFAVSSQYRAHCLCNVLTTVCAAASLLPVLAYFIGTYILPDLSVGGEYAAFVAKHGASMLAASAILPVIAMVIREIAEYMGYEEDVKRYAWYHKVFKRAIIEIDEAYKEGRNEDMRRKLFEIGEEALIENADWVMINANRTPEVPTN